MGPCSMYSVVVVSEYLGGCDGVLYDPELCNENILSTASLSIEVFVAACIAAAGPVDNQVVFPILEEKLAVDFVWKRFSTDGIIILYFLYSSRHTFQYVSLIP